jgi:hypothetical protein
VTGQVTAGTGSGLVGGHADRDGVLLPGESIPGDDYLNLKGVHLRTG